MSRETDKTIAQTLVRKAAENGYRDGEGREYNPPHNGFFKIKSGEEIEEVHAYDTAWKAGYERRRK